MNSDQTRYRIVPLKNLMWWTVPAPGNEVP